MADVQRMRRLGRRFKREGLTLTKQAAEGLARQLRRFVRQFALLLGLGLDPQKHHITLICREDNPDEKLNGILDALKVHLDRQQRMPVFVIALDYNFRLALDVLLCLRGLGA